MKYGLFAFFLGLMLLPAVAMAQDTPAASKIPPKREYLPEAGKTLEELSAERPVDHFVSKRTDNMTVAMLFHKLTGQRPDFAKWSRQSRSFQEAPEAERPAILQNMIQQLETRFELMGFDEPIHIENYVTLSQYNPASEGFFIEEFNDNSFFTYVFDGAHYAVVPTDLMDYEWIKIARDRLEQIGPHITEKNQIFMRLSLTPLSADAREQVRLSNGQMNWLMAARVLDIEFWSPQDQSLLWRSNDDFYRRKNELLNLYR